MDEEREAAESKGIEQFNIACCYVWNFAQMAASGNSIKSKLQL